MANLPDVTAGRGCSARVSEDNDVHELFLMCDDIPALVAEMKQKEVKCSPVDEQRWGWITRLTPPGRRGNWASTSRSTASPLKANAT